MLVLRMGGANCGQIGTARLTREGEVRWTTYSIFSGQERWKSEGIQVGGRRSARGVVGNWFEKYGLVHPLYCYWTCRLTCHRDYDPHGPCGPTAFWKISDRESQSDDQQVLLNDFLPIVDGYEHEFEEGEDEDEYFEDPDEDHIRVAVYLPDDLESIELDN